MANEADLSSLRRHVRTYRPLALLHYDRLEQNQFLIDSLSHTVDNRILRENPVRLEHLFAFAEAFRWGDEVVTGNKVDRLEWAVPMDGYESAFPYPEVDLVRPQVAARLESIVPQVPVALLRKKMSGIGAVFRKNQLTMDGQNFWSSAHPHPAGQGTYDNTIALGFGDPANPTRVEIEDLLDRVLERFAANGSIQAEYIETTELAKHLIVFTHNLRHNTLFGLVTSKPQNDNEPNRFHKTFRVFVDRKPAAGDENKIEFFLNDAGAPKPAFFVPDKAPWIDAWNTNRFGQGFVAWGMKEQWGVKPGFPNNCIQAS